MEKYLRSFVCHRPSEWFKWLTFAEFWFNTTWKVATKITPCEAIYGKQPSTLLSYVPNTSKIQEVEQQLCSKDITLPFLKENLSLSQEKMKKYVDNRRSKREFQVNDWVYLTLQPYG